MAGFKEATNEMYADSDLDEDGVHGGRMKPLSSLGIPAKKASNSSTKFGPSQVFTMAKVGTKARHRTSLYGSGRRNSIMRIQRMHARSKKFKKINRRGSRHGGKLLSSGIEDKATTLPILENRAGHFKATKDKDIDSASNFTCKGLESSTKVLDCIIFSSGETAPSCSQGQNCLDLIMHSEDLSGHDLSVLDARNRLAPGVHLNLAKSREKKAPLPSTAILKRRIPAIQEDNAVNPSCTKSCIDPMSKKTPSCITKTKNEDESVACGFLADATTCDYMPVTKGYYESIKASSCFQFSDVLYEELEIKKGIKPPKADPGLPLQAADKYRHAFRKKYSHATSFGSHSANFSGFTKRIQVEKTALERFLTTNSKMLKSQMSMDKQGGSPQVLGDLDVLKQIRELNPGIISRLRDKKQVHAALGAIIGTSTANTIFPEKNDLSLKIERQHGPSGDENQGLDCKSEGRPTKRRKSIEYGLRLAPKKLPATGDIVKLVDMKTQAVTQATHTMAVNNTEQTNSCKHFDTDAGIYKIHCPQTADSIVKNLSMLKPEDETDLSRAKQHRDTGTNCLSDPTIPGQGRSHTLLQVANKNTANAASCWLELLRLDIKGRLSALKRSRKRIQSVIASDQVDNKMCCADDAFQKASRWDMAGEGNRDSQTAEADKWRVFFLQMDSVLHSEGARLENWLNQIDEMQAHCQKGYCNG